MANKVAKMVRDRRRRVRQAALDTLAVLAQIYESEVRILYFIYTLRETLFILHVQCTIFEEFSN